MIIELSRRYRLQPIRRYYLVPLLMFVYPVIHQNIAGAGVKTQMVTVATGGDIGHTANINNGTVMFVRGESSLMKRPMLAVHLSAGGDIFAAKKSATVVMPVS